MVTLMLLGAVIPVHVVGEWRRRINRMTGIAMLTINALFVVTAFGLYYIGSEVLRGWASDLHIGLGFTLPALLAAHVMRGRRISRLHHDD